MVKKKAINKTSIEKARFTIMIINGLIVLLSPVWFMLIDMIGWYTTAGTVIMILLTASIITFLISLGLIKNKE